MKLIIVRHGDPDYEHDSLTEKGCREAEFLSDRLTRLDVKEFYCSPLGRAKKTASYTLEKLGRTAVICDWLREFDTPPVIDPETGERRLAWDQLPAVWTAIPEYYDKDNWVNAPMMRDADMAKYVGAVNEGIDKIIEDHGYKRCGNYYSAITPNTDTIVLFCHFGVTCVILGHILGLSPMILWHGGVTLPTSVTTLVTEERREGIAYFRMNGFGDISHLYAGGEPASFSARFCEMYSNSDERHD